tara:strand:+ start:246 stop:368 length:123 start_codon:yes stop_codon:yes gene_type:complete
MLYIEPEALGRMDTWRASILASERDAVTEISFTFFDPRCV